ncbi:hypothetical protein CI109_101944 [Kwoniella shandongensis]|uniref:Uncharacterized protein n=1 Tax=Kwoniella shandongensis TaxID=1734106 RepID=A0A5M6BWF5_9TREE|nr:uncharacterized protein CI109_005396 [Kwoniella shandongensis]KAA5526272.1 hypothetical protein CI109_005396 [Kwoniella shandongensis]
MAISFPILIPLLLPFLHSAKAQRHSNDQWNNGIVIPTSTIVAIGIGFVAFGISVILLLFIHRVLKVRRVARARGEPFSVVWEREGGFWGFLNSVGESSALGAGGVPSRRLARWDWSTENGKEIERPEMWEVSWYDQEEELKNPLAVCPSSYPDTKPKVPPLPTIDIAVLISLPSPTIPDPEELPNLIVGTTSLIPIVHSPLSRVISAESDQSDGMVEDKLKGQVKEVEYVSSDTGGVSRRANWAKSDKGQWYIEGIE